MQDGSTHFPYNVILPTYILINAIPRFNSKMEEKYLHGENNPYCETLNKFTYQTYLHNGAPSHEQS